ncbi:MAG TPA: hypothetical protein VK207_09400, partial [Bacteroidales bacterium]|nr:hypothetical protein [Bacteroidales bacterium]
MKKFFMIICFFAVLVSCSGRKGPAISYTISMANPSAQVFHVGISFTGIQSDTVVLSMPAWMPGYYQIMNYAEKVNNVSATGTGNDALHVTKKDIDSWQVTSPGKSFTFSYDVKADRRFVANSFLDTTHAYIVPESVFMFVEGMSVSPLSIKVEAGEKWNDIATGLQRVPGKTNEFTAADPDMLYDCPILVGNLQELPSFEVGGIRHRFIGYDMGEFDGEALMAALKKIVGAAFETIGEIPYDEYTFIGIGPGAGGIEHLNCTTVSFNGNRMKDAQGMTGVLKFLAHEYFHNYNVKRIRPLELGPFDYSRENRTNLLWVSE